MFGAFTLNKFPTTKAMFTFKVFVFITTISVAIGEVDYTTECKNDYRDENNTKINVAEYCSKKLCIEKCCGKDGLFDRFGRCMSKTKRMKSPKMLAKYNAITNVLSSENATKIPPRDYVFIYNLRNLNKCTAEHAITDEYQILEDGSVNRREATGTTKWSTINRLTYCIDYKIYFKSKESKEPFVKIIIREITADLRDTDKIEKFETVGIIISSFFLLLLLIVYCLLPELRNLSGLVLMAYTFSLLFAYIAKVILNFISKNPPQKFCERMSPVLYFGFMSSIFWLSVISYDVWSALRSCRISRGTKDEERVRFLWYGLYAWGTPLIMTTIVVALDKIPNLDIVKPPFDNCFHAGRGFNYYFRIPIGILIFMNTVLFIVTIANIWMVKHAVNKKNSSKRQNTKFGTYAKLSTIMGVNWCLELIQTEIIFWKVILINVYNIFVVVALFYLFVCQRRTLALLCKKFNIKHDFTKYTETSRRDKSSMNTKSSFFSRFTFKSKSRKEQNHVVKTEETPKDEIAVV